MPTGLTDVLNHVLMNLPSLAPPALGYGLGPNPRPPLAQPSAVIYSGGGGGRVFSSSLQINPIHPHSSLIETYDLPTLLRNPHVAQLFRDLQAMRSHLQTTNAQLQVAYAQYFKVSQMHTDLVKESHRVANDTFTQAPNQRANLVPTSTPQ